MTSDEKVKNYEYHVNELTRLEKQAIEHRNALEVLKFTANFEGSTEKFAPKPTKAEKANQVERVLQDEALTIGGIPWDELEPNQQRLWFLGQQEKRTGWVKLAVAIETLDVTETTFRRHIGNEIIKDQKGKRCTVWIDVRSALVWHIKFLAE